MLWETWKKGFDTWEQTTAKYLETWLKSPIVLEPMGKITTATLKLKTQRDRAVTGWWAALGLPTKRDQERTLHALNQIQTRLLDLEERLVQTKN